MWNILRQGWSGNYAIHGDPRTAQCAIGFSFGAVRTDGVLQPGPSNEALAAVLRERFAHLPLIVQGEIADVLLAKLPTAQIHRIGDLCDKGPYLDSRLVAERAAVLMRQNGWKRVVVVAHPYHMPRADAVCRALGMDTIAPEGLERVPFCASSVQWWTRDAVRWRMREVPATVFYALRGWLLSL